MVRYLQSWIDELRWQRLAPFQKLAHMLLDHLDGILNYCRTKVRFGVVEAINGNIKTLFRRGRGYKNLVYLLLNTFSARPPIAWWSGLPTCSCLSLLTNFHGASFSGNKRFSKRYCVLLAFSTPQSELYHLIETAAFGAHRRKSRYTPVAARLKSFAEIA